MVEELEAHVISRMQSGDHVAYRQVLDHHLAQLMAYATRLTGSVPDAEDIVQETFVRLWTNRQRYDPSKARLSTWLHRIAHNQFVDSYRRTRDRKADGDEDSSVVHGPDAFLESATQGQAVSQALMQLDERQRSALVLVHYQGMPHKDVADILDVSVDALESMLRRSRKKLKDILVKP
ncbi:MAG: sigma-70 family RNA polymerase sigma factor [Pseudomonadales bacterium]|jgi:RNA polymerase sigma-70 factor (ECF subfamily)|nr:sigma-70 family RNA polymerase sigma factor [Pseudomonadales bacterium]